MAAADLPLEDALADGGAEIDIQQRAGEAAHGHALDHGREKRQQPRDLVELTGAEAPDPVARPGRDLMATLEEGERDGQIIGAAGLAQRLQQGIGPDRGLILQPVAGPAAAFDHHADRAVAIIGAVEDIVGHAEFFRHARLAPPAIAVGPRLRMQGRQGDRGPPEGHALPDQTPAEFVEESRRRGRRPALAQKPLGH